MERRRRTAASTSRGEFARRRPLATGIPRLRVRSGRYVAFAPKLIFSLKPMFQVLSVGATSLSPDRISAFGNLVVTGR